LKKIIRLLLSVALLLPSFGASASAASKPVHVFVDGVPISKGINVNGSIFVPFRGIFEKLGLKVSHDAKKKEVTGTRTGLTVKLTVGKKMATVNGVSKELTAAPFIQNGTTYIPVRLVALSTGNNVSWQSQANLVHVITPAFKGITYEVDGGISVTLYKDGSIKLSETGITGEDIITYVDLAEGKEPKNFVTLQPDTEIEVEEEPGYKGYPDSTDTAIEWAIAFGLPQPPLLSEGWISTSLLQDIEKIYVGTKSDNKAMKRLYKSSIQGQTTLIEIVLPEDFVTTDYGEAEVDGIKMKKHDREIYFNISDLEKAGVIK